jgi:hypothetical protein
MISLPLTYSLAERGEEPTKAAVRRLMASISDNGSGFASRQQRTR